MKTLTPQQIVERLAQSLDLLTGGPRDTAQRQQTLRATIEWSYQLLDQEEQTLFARLAVFVGGCTLNAAEQVADAKLDLLQSLVDKNLLRHSNERFWMLETIRELALEKLELLDDVEQLRRRHAEYLLELPTARSKRVAGRGSRLSSTAESNNLRAAVALGAPAAGCRPCARAGFARRADQCVRARAFVRRRPASGRPRRTGLHADALLKRPSSIGSSATSTAPTRSRQALDLFRALGDEVGQSGALQRMAFAAHARGDFDRARALLEESLELAEAAGASTERRMGATQPRRTRAPMPATSIAPPPCSKRHCNSRLTPASNHAANIEHGLGDTALAAGDTEAAERHYLSALSRAHEWGHTNIDGLVSPGSQPWQPSAESTNAQVASGEPPSHSERESGLPIHAHELARYEDALASAAGVPFEQAAHATRQLDPNDALAAALADEI